MFITSMGSIEEEDFNSIKQFILAGCTMKIQLLKLTNHSANPN